MEEQTSSPSSASLTSLFFNIIASPSEAIDALCDPPTRVSTWVVPLIFLMLVAALSPLTMLNDGVRHQAMESQNRQLQARVESGAMTQEQADQATDYMERSGPTILIVMGMVGALIFTQLVFFGSAPFLWLTGRFALKGRAIFGKYLELWGTTQWIGVLGTLVALLMILGFQSLYASPSGAMAVLSSFEPTNTTHRLLASANIFSVWQMCVVGIGLSKYAQRKIGLGIAIASGLWIIWVLISTFIVGAIMGM